MNVSIVLIAYHGDRWLPPCLASLAEASHHRLHLVLVDNSGNTGIDRLDLSAFEAEVLQTPYPMGFAEANNYALVQASCLNDVVLFLNQDTINPSGWIDACLEVLDKHPDLGAVSPVIRTYDDDGWDPSFLACLDEEVQAQLEASNPPRILSTHNAPAPALLVRTDVLRQVGPFDPVFGSYYEDYDLCRRIRQAGYRIGFVTNARIRHFSGSSTTTPERERKRMRQIIRNRVLYQLREQPGSRRQHALRYFGKDLPRRLIRGLLRTPSSQPPVVTLQAYSDLLRIGRRLMSQPYDERQWQAYLGELGWPPPVPDLHAQAHP